MQPNQQDNEKNKSTLTIQRQQNFEQ